MWVLRVCRSNKGHTHGWGFSSEHLPCKALGSVLNFRQKERERKEVGGGRGEEGRDWRDVSMFRALDPFVEVPVFD